MTTPWFDPPERKRGPEVREVARTPRQRGPGALQSAEDQAKARIARMPHAEWAPPDSVPEPRGQRSDRVGDVGAGENINK
eukprot:11359501-Alexandrium_andersonii.AAC.1